MLRINNLIGFGSTRPSTFNSIIKGTDAVLSARDKEVNNFQTGIVVWTTARGTRPKNEGLYYFEIRILALQNIQYIIIGLINGTNTSGASLNSYLGAIGESVGIRPNQLFNTTAFVPQTGFSVSNWVPGVIVMVAVNFTNGSIWFGENGTWYSGTPSTGTSLRNVSFTPGMTLFPAASVLLNTEKVRLQTGNGELSYPPPPNYLAWG